MFLQVSASVELIRVANAAGAAAVAAAAAFFASSTPCAPVPPAPSPPVTRVHHSEVAAKSPAATAAAFRYDSSLPGFFSHRSSSLPAARHAPPPPASSSLTLSHRCAVSAVQLNAAIIHAAAVVLHDCLPLLQRHVPLVLSEMLVCFTEPPGWLLLPSSHIRIMTQFWSKIL
jgi:hypothetical protein